ncbi:hypothetical protein JW710_02255 [Candidatus Dojkabacteria bacterium]|nr:hypothetical protein [Candidatus Dojkabacteria bacterium]
MSDLKDSSSTPKSEENQTSSPKKSGRGKTVVIILLVLAIILVCCVSAGIIGYIIYKNSEGDGKSTFTPKKFDLTLNEVQQEVTQTFGTDAGEIEVTDNSSPIFGTKIQIGENFLDEEEQISISFREITDLDIPDDLNAVSDLIVLTKTNPDLMFNHPVAVTIPYDKTETKYGELIGAYEYDEDTGTIESTTLLEHDQDNGTVTFLTSHFTNFFLIELEKTWNDIKSGEYDTGFRPVNDGWFIENWGAYITDRGNCIGMSTVAKYVYSHQDLFDDEFYDALREGDVDDQKDDKIANELAARAQLSLSNRWNTIKQDLDRFSKLEQPSPSSFHGKAILMNFFVTGEPQVLYVMKFWKEYKTDGTWVWKTGRYHAIMTYKYEGGKFALYDPNFPYRKGKTSWDNEVTYSWDKGFGVYDDGYGGYNYFRHIGPNLVIQDSLIAGLIDKAKGGFQDDEFPEIEFYSPEDGSTVTGKSVVITGKVSGGKYETEAGEKYMHWYHQNEKGGIQYVRGPVNADGTFSQELPVVPGSNTVNVLLAGSQPNKEWAGYDSISFDATVKPADMIVTLTWSKNQSDIDLHVTDPQGNHVWYSNMNAPTGAQLDFDNTSGYGPEHYTISSEEGDQMPYGNYKVDVVYYADHDADYDSTQPVPWTITARWVSRILPDTQEKIWESVTRSGVLTSEGQTTGAYTINYEEPATDEIEIVANPFGI